MKLVVDLQYEVSPSELLDIFADEEFIRFKAKKTKSSVDSVEINRNAEGATTSIVVRAFSSELVPSQARGLVGDKLKIRQTEAWAEPLQGLHGPRHGSVCLEISGAPVRLNATATLTPTATGATLRYEGDVKSPIPLFGAPLERAAASAIKKILDKEAACVKLWANK